MRYTKELIIATVGLALGAILNWTQPYGETTMFGIHIWALLGVGVFICTVVLSLNRVAKPMIFAVWISAGVGLAVVLRIIYDLTFFDPTSHSLAPFEVIVSLVVAFVSALLAGYLGGGLRRGRTKE